MKLRKLEALKKSEKLTTDDLYQIKLLCKLNRLYRAIRAHFFEYALPVRIDGMDADWELIGDFFTK